jgi:hypothetical protein
MRTEKHRELEIGIMISVDRGPELAAVAIGFTASSFICVVLRCYTTAVILKRFRFEDGLALFAWVSDENSVSTAAQARHPAGHLCPLRDDLQGN